MVGLGAIISFQTLGTRKLQAASASLKGVQLEANKTTTSLAVLGKQSKILMGAGIGMTIAGAIGIAVLGKMVGGATIFATTMADVGAVTRATTGEIRTMTRFAEEMAMKTKFAPVQVGKAMYELSSYGLSVNEVLAATPPVLDLAVAGQLELAEASTAAMVGLKAFGFQAEQTRYVVDLLVRGTQVSALHMNEYARSLGYVASAGKLVGYSAEETMAAFAMIRSTTGTAQQAAQEVKQTLNYLATATGPSAQKAFKGIGDILGRTFDVFNRATGAVRPFTDIVFDLSVAWEKATGEQKIALRTYLRDIFRVGGMRGVLKAMGMEMKTSTGEMLKGSQAIAYLTGKFKQASGASAEYANRLREQWSYFVEWLGGSISLIMVKVGQPLMEVLNEHIRPVLERIVNLLVSLTERHPELVKFVAVFGGIASAAMLVVGPILTLIGALGMLTVMAAPAGGALAVLSVGFHALNASLGPIGLILLALTAIIIGVWMAIKHWDKIVAFAKNIWEHVSAYFRNVGKRIKAIFTEMWNDIKAVFITIGTWLKTYWKDILLAVFCPIGLGVKYVINHWEQIVPFFRNINERIKGIFVQMWESIKGVFTGVGTWLKTHWKTLVLSIVFPAALGVKYIIKHWDKIKGFFVNLVNKIKSVFVGYWEFMKSGFIRIAEFIKRPFIAVRDFLVTLWTGIIDWFKQIPSMLKEWVLGPIHWLQDKLAAIPLIGKIFAREEVIPTPASTIERATSLITPVARTAMPMVTGGAPTVSVEIPPLETPSPEILETLGGVKIDRIEVNYPPGTKPGTQAEIDILYREFNKKYQIEKERQGMGL